MSTMIVNTNSNECVTRGCDLSLSCGDHRSPLGEHCVRNLNTSDCMWSNNQFTSLKYHILDCALVDSRPCSGSAKSKWRCTHPSSFRNFSSQCVWQLVREENTIGDS